MEKLSFGIVNMVRYEVVMSPFNPANRARWRFTSKREACRFARSRTSDRVGSITVEVVDRYGPILLAVHYGGESPRLQWL
jgi:hypothetical protein